MVNAFRLINVILIILFLFPIFSYAQSAPTTIQLQNGWNFVGLGNQYNVQLSGDILLYYFENGQWKKNIGSNYVGQKPFWVYKGLTGTLTAQPYTSDLIANIELAIGPNPIFTAARFLGDYEIVFNGVANPVAKAINEDKIIIYKWESNKFTKIAMGNLDAGPYMIISTQAAAIQSTAALKDPDFNGISGDQREQLLSCGDKICSPSETCIWDNCCNGITQQLDTDSQNCGFCGNICKTDEKCNDGVCITAKLSDGEPCISSLSSKKSDSCAGGYCVHGYCQFTENYCGDGFCDEGENRGNCPQDCLEPVIPDKYLFDSKYQINLWNTPIIKKYSSASVKFESNAIALDGCATQEPDSALEKTIKIPSNAKQIKIRFTTWAVNDGGLIVTLGDEVIK